MKRDEEISFSEACQGFDLQGDVSVSDRMTEMFPRINAGPLRSRCQESIASAGPPPGVSWGRWDGSGRAGTSDRCCSDICYRRRREQHSRSLRHSRASEAQRPPGSPWAEVWRWRTDAHGGRCLPRSVTVWAISLANRTSLVVSICSPATSHQVPSLHLLFPCRAVGSHLPRGLPAARGATRGC